MSNPPTIKLKVQTIVQDDSGKLAIADQAGDDSFDKCIAAALNTFSRHRPALAVEDITGDGTHDYDLPTAWVADFSTLKSIEYPIGEQPEAYLDSDEYKLYQSPDGVQIRLVNDTPQATEEFRVTFTILRDGTTIPASDEDAFCNLSAALCLEELANAWLHDSDSVINADVVDRKSKSERATARAKRLMQLYKEHMGIKDDDVTPAASAVTDLDMKYPGGSERLTHLRRDRKKR